MLTKVASVAGLGSMEEERSSYALFPFNDSDTLPTGVMSCVKQHSSVVTQPFPLSSSLTILPNPFTPPSRIRLSIVLSHPKFHKLFKPSSNPKSCCLASHKS
ncbi:hypothetical protein L2E82_40468 [Cichorium intybus]|uniref:Uncharacterized protein n=1 Tax=Cichorium intybus TaxID=13427 RepID=A0ACB9AM15_CICIN|nr:hypothetical protein L2E82_40468 [Cichorium intybus]